MRRIDFDMGIAAVLSTSVALLLTVPYLQLFRVAWTIASRICPVYKVIQSSK